MKILDIFSKKYKILRKEGGGGAKTILRILTIEREKGLRFFKSSLSN